jgi:hypothetical protein
MPAVFVFRPDRQVAIHCGECAIASRVTQGRAGCPAFCLEAGVQSKYLEGINDLKNVAAILVLAVWLVACAPAPSLMATATAQPQAATPTVTPLPTATIEPTQTFTPVPTPTQTPRPTDTPQPTTPSPTIEPTSTLACPCSIWRDSDKPNIPNANDHQPLQLGVKFRSGVDGYVTGLRFYKGSQNTGVHRGQLYALDGTLLSEAVFTHEMASGWQTVYFTTPVTVTAGTTYVASYYSPSGYYAFSYNYFGTAISHPPLTALANGTDGRNGVYRYSIKPTFPTASYVRSNYWVDVVFQTTVTPTQVVPASMPTATPN